MAARPLVEVRRRRAGGWSRAAARPRGAPVAGEAGPPVAGEAGPPVVGEARSPLAGEASPPVVGKAGRNREPSGRADASYFHK